MRQQYWHHALPGVIAVMGWATIFIYGLLLNKWWAMMAVLSVTLFAGALNAAIAMPKKKEGIKKAHRSVGGPPGTH